METSVKRLVSIPEARHLLGNIGHTTVYELIKHREIVKVNIGRIESMVTRSRLSSLVLSSFRARRIMV